MNTGETEGFENLITVVELHIKELNTSAFQNVFPDIGFHQIERILLVFPYMQNQKKHWNSLLSLLRFQSSVAEHHNASCQQ
jgi:hypothetical protein